MTYYVAVGAKGEAIVTTSPEARDEQLQADGCNMTAGELREFGLRNPGVPRYWATTEHESFDELRDYLRDAAPEILGDKDRERWVETALADVL
ncbi:MAG: hypothetical protein QJR02_07335 [Sinobacteraceae bacterium]|nr:hypothetical protein [Nevskiaceae bacterium]